ncbi:MAG: trimethylamine methyltransferase family protein, partial [Chloroflexota bacterium]
MSRTRSRRRGQRTPSKAKSPLAHIPWQPIVNHMPPLEYITPAEIERLHEASLRILEETGIAFMEPEALDIWEKAGATVDHKREVVKIDRHLLLELVAKAPSHFKWRARNPAKSIMIGKNHVNFVPQGGVVFVSDLDRGRRPGVMADYINFLKMQQQCNSLQFGGEQIIVPHDVEVSFRHLQRSLAALTLTDKCYQEAPHGRIISEDAIEMAKIVFQEDITQSNEPVVAGVINASSPLRYDERMIGGMIAFAKAN